MKTLYIYKGINPNQEETLHYYFASSMSYINELESHIIGAVGLDNYRINANVAKIKYEGNIKDNYKLATYIIEYDTTTDKIKCFWVNKITLQDFIIYDLTIDLWATYISQAQLSNMHVTRCNRAINAYGIIDEPFKTYGTIITKRIAPRDFLEDYSSDQDYIKESKLFIVFVVEFNISQQTFGTEHITTTRMLACSLSYIRSKINNQYINEIGTLVASDFIGGIYKTDADTDARVIKAWLVPVSLLQLSTYGVNFKTKSLYTNSQEVTFNASFVRPFRKFNVFNINYSNYKGASLYFGTFNNGLKLTKYIGLSNYAPTYTLETEIMCNVGIDNLEIIISQGEEQKDITTAFELSITTANATTTQLQKLARSITLSVTQTRNIVKDFASGGGGATGVLNALGGYASSWASLVPQTRNLDKAIGGGDGGTNYFVAIVSFDNNTWARNPFCLFGFNATNNVERETRQKGALFDYYLVDGLQAPFNYNLLGSAMFDETFITLTCRVEGVPLEAKNEITRKFANGIYYKVV